MFRILVNGISAKSGGGRSILSNFLEILKSRDSSYTFSVIVPDDSYSQYASDHIQLIPMPVFSHSYLLPFINSFYLPKFILKNSYDCIFNLADIPIPIKSKQIFLFDWSYAVFPDSLAWQRASFINTIRRRLKLFLFQRYVSYIDVVIAQSILIGDRLNALYNFSRLQVIPNAVALDNLNEGESFDYAFGSGFKLLCLSNYYSHKNLEVLIDLAELIRSKSLDIKIILTIDSAQGKGARRLIESIVDRKLDEVIINVGSVPMSLVPSLYQQVDALLLPTLLESFSGTYVEAMFHGIPIFTSEFDFAIDVCQDAAFYFDPLNSHDILSIFRIFKGWRYLFK